MYDVRKNVAIMYSIYTLIGLLARYFKWDVAISIDARGISPDVYPSLMIQDTGLWLGKFLLYLGVKNVAQTDDISTAAATKWTDYLSTYFTKT